MRVFRIIFASLLVLFALGLLVGQVGISLDKQEEHFGLFDHFVLVALWLLTGVTAAYFFRSRNFWNARLTCPHCQQTGSLQPSVVHPSRISLLGWILGGIIGSLLYSHSRKHRFSCTACSHSCELRSVGSHLALAWLMMLVLLIFYGIYAEIHSA
jgi:hypothetical protein